MQKEYRSLRRRPFLAPVWIFWIAALLGLALAGWAVLAATTTVVVVMRHAETAADGTQDPPLSTAGTERAARLATIFGGSGHDLPIEAIFVTQWRRTAATARPLAASLAVPVIAVEADDVKGLARRILGEFRGRRVLVVAHNPTVPELVRTLANRADVPALREDEFGTIYIVAVPRWSRPALLRLALP
jgi:broad specificity phosphatase PhoE